MNGDITRVEVEQAVVTEHRVKEFNGLEFVPEKIQHLAYIYEGDYYRISTLFGEHADNLSLYPWDGRDWLGDWPTPPAWFEEAAERLRLEAEELAAIRERASAEIRARVDAARQAAASGTTGLPPNIDGLSISEALDIFAESAEDVPYLLDRLDRAEATIARLEAAIRLVSPDHITPQGARIIRAALTEETK